MQPDRPDHRLKHAAEGELPPWWTALPRRRLAVALGSTFVAVPVVVVDNLPRQDVAKAEAVEVVAPSTSVPLRLAAPAQTVVTVPSTTATTATMAPPETTTAPPAPETTTTAAPPTTAPPPPPTTAPPPPPTTAPPAPAAAAPANRESGKATWYEWREGECAHKTLPRGTVVTITNLANGATATCVVTDRGPFGRGRIIDLDDGTFAQLAPLSAGIIDVTISW